MRGNRLLRENKQLLQAAAQMEANNFYSKMDRNSGDNKIRVDMLTYAIIGEETPEEWQGLATDTVRNCVSLVLYDGSQVLLTHFPLDVSPKSLEPMFRRMQGTYRMTLIFSSDDRLNTLREEPNGNDYFSLQFHQRQRQQFLELLGGFLSHSKIAAWSEYDERKTAKGMCYVDRRGSIFCDPLTRNDYLGTSKLEKPFERHAQTVVNYDGAIKYGRKTHNELSPDSKVTIPFDCYYDTNHWNFLAPELTKEGKRLYSDFEKSSVSDFHELAACLHRKAYTEHWERKKAQLRKLLEKYRVIKQEDDKTLIAQDNVYLALKEAVKNTDSLSDIEDLFKYAGDINHFNKKTKKTLLDFANEAGNQKTIDFLVAQGCKTHAQIVSERESRKSISGLLTGAASSTMFVASRLSNANNEKLEEILKRCKITGNDDEAKEKALRRAASLGNIEDVKFLLDIGVNIDSQDQNPENKKTALHWAIINKHPEVIKYLLEKNARSDIADAKGNTALNYIEESETEEIRYLASIHRALGSLAL